MQVILGRMHVVSGAGADKLDPAITADCHTSSVTLSPSHSHTTQAIHSQVGCQRALFTLPSSCCRRNCI